jgi:hypothetical protein
MLLHCRLWSVQPFDKFLYEYTTTASPAAKKTSHLKPQLLAAKGWQVTFLFLYE